MDLATGRTRTVPVGGGAIHLAEWGAGRPLLLLHGNPDSSLMWERVAPILAAQFRCLAPDLPGFGHSQVPAGFAPWEEKLPALVAHKPTLVLWGDRDPYIPARFAERFGAAAVVRLPEIGHWPPVEAPAETAAHMLRHFAADRV